MKLSSRLLTLAIVAAAVALFASDELARQLFATIAALASLAVALESPPGLLRHLARILLPWAVAFACAAVYLAAQLLPLPIAPPADVAWSGVAAALAPPPPGHLTIDLGATLLALEGLTACLVLALTAMAIAIERDRAERTLTWLAAASTAAAVAWAASGYLAPPTAEAIAAARSAPFAATSGLGAIVNLALIFHVAENQGAPAERRTPRRRLLRLALLALADAVCLAVVAAKAPLFVAAAIGFGVLAFLVVATIRRLGLAFWPAALATTVAMALVVVAIAHGLSATSGDLTQRFAAAVDPAAIAAGDRALADLDGFGGGAGASAELLSIYGGFGAPAPIRAPTTAADWTIGLGRPAFAIAVVWAAGAAVFLLRSALVRGRDWIYAAAAAAAILTVVAEAFTDPSLTTPSLGALAAILLGLGVGQSVRRSASSLD